MVEAEFLLAIEDAGHQAVDSESRNGRAAASPSGTDDEVNCAFVVSNVHEDP